MMASPTTTPTVQTNVNVLGTSVGRTAPELKLRTSHPDNRL